MTAGICSQSGRQRATFLGGAKQFSVRELFLSTAHTPVIGAGYPTGQSRIGPFGSPGAELDANVAVGLCLNIDCHVLLASASTNHSFHSVSDSDTLILRRANSRTSGAIECAGRRHIRGNRLRDNAARKQHEHSCDHYCRPSGMKMSLGRHADRFGSHSFELLSPQEIIELALPASLPRHA
jgi:hypothetical protein